VRKLADTLPGSLTLMCNVTVDEDIEGLAHRLKEEVGVVHGLAHCIAFAKAEELDGLYVDTSRAGFALAHDVSVYSLTAVAQRLHPLMTEGGSIVTLTYLGAQRSLPNYNVMGVAKAALETSVKYLAMDLGPENIRVNAISAGPIKTLAASGIGDFRYILKWNELNSPLRRNVTIEDVGGAGVYFLSDLSSGVTGEIHHVDAGYNVIGMKAEDAPDITLA
jgi:enoyl-[acyl-carrier protein] reductase I